MMRSARVWWLPHVLPLAVLLLVVGGALTVSGNYRTLQLAIVGETDSRWTGWRAAARHPEGEAILEPSVIVEGVVDGACWRLTDDRVACGRPDGPPVVVLPGPYQQLRSMRMQGPLGQRPDGTWVKLRTQSAAPVPPERGEVRVGHHRCQLQDEGRITCEGPRRDLAPPPGRFVSLVQISSGLCALRVDGTVLCWGLLDVDPADALGTVVQIGTVLTDICGVRPDRRSIRCQRITGAPRSLQTFEMPGSARVAGLAEAGGRLFVVDEGRAAYTVDDGGALVPMGLDSGALLECLCTLFPDRCARAGISSHLVGEVVDSRGLPIDCEVVRDDPTLHALLPP